MSRKKWMLFIIKCVVSACLMAWILQGVRLREIPRAVARASVPLIVCAFGLHFVGAILTAARWRLLLRARDIVATHSYLLRSCMAGTFFNHFLPSIIGGDLVRVHDTCRIGATKSDALAVIVVDRALGLLSLIGFAFVAVWSTQEFAAQAPTLARWVSIGAGGLALGFVLLFMPARRFAHQPAATCLPNGITERLFGRLLRAFLSFRGHKAAVFKALGLSFLLQCNVVVYYFLLSRAMGFAIGFEQFFLIVPLAIFVMTVPISINGIGLRESAFTYFLGVFSVSKPEAVAYAWLSFATFTAYGLVGGVIYALRK